MYVGVRTETHDRVEPASGCIRELDLSAVGLDQRAGDREPEATSLALSRAPEAVERPQSLPLPEAGTVVPDAQLQPRRDSTGEDGDGPLGAGRLDGVLDQVVEHLPDSLLRGVRREGSIEFFAQAHAPFLRQRRPGLEPLPHERVQVDALWRSSARTAPGETEQALDERAQPVDLVHGPFQVAAAGLAHLP